MSMGAIRTKSRYNPRGGFYWICPECGAHLDSGEQCTCQEEKPKKETKPPEDPAELLRIIERLYKEQ